jgi:cytochrome c556
MTDRADNPTVEDHIRATAEARGLDPDDAVEHWKQALTRAATGAPPIDRADNTARLALELAAAKAEIERWEDWSNDLAEHIPEQYDGDDAQEAIIEKYFDDLRAEQAALLARAEAAEAEVKALRERIEALHEKTGGGWCSTCWEQKPTAHPGDVTWGPQDWPCATILALAEPAPSTEAES